MPSQYGERWPTSGWDGFGSLGHPSKFQRISHLGFVTAPTSLKGDQPNFARCLTTWAGTPYVHCGGFCPVTEFVRSFVITGRGPVYSGPQRGDRQLVHCACPGREEGNWLVCASVCMMCREGRLSRHDQLVGYLLAAPPQGMAYCLARPGWNFFRDSPLGLLQC